MNNDKPALEWDECKIAEEEARYRQTTEWFDLHPEDQEKQERDLFSEVLEDADFFKMEWDGMCDALKEIMGELQKRAYYKTHWLWTAEVENFGWRHMGGTASFRSEDGHDFLQRVLPKTQCTFSIFVDKRARQIRINNAHHDAPTGNEWYTIRPARKKEVETMEFTGHRWS